MKKLISTLLATGLLLSTSSVLAYNANFTNNTDTQATLKAAGNVVTTIDANSSVSLQLDPYTAYALSYKGKWADQGLGTIQKYTNLVYQITPVNPASGINNINVSIQADGQDGYVHNVNDAGNNVYGGICSQDTGGVTCTLSQGAGLKQLHVVLENIN
ncbi:hypothetical protein [Facilibium subflavum]|uniref:hypothetical protein n=1 Tax=Facilibium subflavum TaxID=2219058 RepID=UPI000E64A29D|nr:hypothetical protein [Facilibium subflavum]